MIALADVGAGVTHVDAFSAWLSALLRLTACQHFFVVFDNKHGHGRGSGGVPDARAVYVPAYLQKRRAKALGHASRRLKAGAPAAPAAPATAAPQLQLGRRRLQQLTRAAEALMDEPPARLAPFVEAVRRQRGLAMYGLPGFEADDMIASLVAGLLDSQGGSLSAAASSSSTQAGPNTTSAAAAPVRVPRASHPHTHPHPGASANRQITPAPAFQHAVIASSDRDMLQLLAHPGCSWLELRQLSRSGSTQDGPPLALWSRELPGIPGSLMQLHTSASAAGTGGGLEYGQERPLRPEGRGTGAATPATAPLPLPLPQASPAGGSPSLLLPPGSYPDYLALVGKDEAGVPGVGLSRRSATKLLLRYGSIAGVVRAYEAGALDESLRPVAAKGATFPGADAGAAATGASGLPAAFPPSVAAAEVAPVRSGASASSSASSSLSSSPSAASAAKPSAPNPPVAIPAAKAAAASANAAAVAAALGRVIVSRPSVPLTQAAGRAATPSIRAAAAAADRGDGTPGGGPAVTGGGREPAREPAAAPRGEQGWPGAGGGEEGWPPAISQALRNLAVTGMHSDPSTVPWERVWGYCRQRLEAQRQAAGETGAQLFGLPQPPRPPAELLGDHRLVPEPGPQLGPGPEGGPGPGSQPGLGAGPGPGLGLTLHPQDQLHTCSAEPFVSVLAAALRRLPGVSLVRAHVDGKGSLADLVLLAASPQDAGWDADCPSPPGPVAAGALEGGQVRELPPGLVLLPSAVSAVAAALGDLVRGQQGQAAAPSSAGVGQRQWQAAVNGSFAGAPYTQGHQDHEDEGGRAGPAVAVHVCVLAPWDFQIDDAVQVPSQQSKKQQKPQAKQGKGAQVQQRPQELAPQHRGEVQQQQQQGEGVLEDDKQGEEVPRDPQQRARRQQAATADQGTSEPAVRQPTGPRAPQGMAEQEGGTVEAAAALHLQAAAAAEAEAEALRALTSTLQASVGTRQSLMHVPRPLQAALRNASAWRLKRLQRNAGAAGDRLVAVVPFYELVALSAPVQ